MCHGVEVVGPLRLVVRDVVVRLTRHSALERLFSRVVRDREMVLLARTSSLALQRRLVVCRGGCRLFARGLPGPRLRACAVSLHDLPKYRTALLPLRDLFLMPVLVREPIGILDALVLAFALENQTR